MDNNIMSCEDFLFSTEEDKEKQHDHNDKHDHKDDHHEDIKEKNKRHLLDVDKMEKKEKDSIFEKLKELPGKASNISKKARLWCRSRKNLFFYQKYLDRVKSGLYDRYGDEAQVRENRMIDDPVTILKGPAKQYIHDIVEDINKLYKEFNEMSERLATKTTAEDCIMTVQHYCKDYIGDKKDGGKRDDEKTSWKIKLLEATKYKISRILLRYGKRSVYGYTSRNMVLKGYPTPNHLMVTMFVNNPEEHPEIQSVKNVFQSVDSFDILASSEKNDIFNIQNMSRSVLEETCDDKVLNDIKECRASALSHFKAVAMDNKKENGKIIDEIWDGMKASGKEILSRKTYLIDCINVYFDMVLRIDNLAVMAIKDMLAVENKYRDKNYDKSLHVKHSGQVGNLSEREEREKEKYDGKSRKEFSNDLQKTAKMLNKM